MVKDNKLKEIITQKFTEYLNENQCRKTPERYAVLDIIYSMPKHFDIESLYNKTREQHFRLSRGTLYNTMQVLVECNLAIKHQFGKNLSVYEIAYNDDFHHHLICNNCNNIREFKDAEIDSLVKNKRMKYFAPSHHSLNIYGICSTCARKQKNEQKNNK